MSELALTYAAGLCSVCGSEIWCDLRASGDSFRSFSGAAPIFHARDPLLALKDIFQLI
jgi:hypothetical protein